MNPRTSSASNTVECSLYDCYPGGNRTYIAMAPQLPRAHYHLVHREMVRLFPQFEQGGYLEQPSTPTSVVRLHMSGGEFCGNALRACAALLVRDFTHGHELSSVVAYQKIIDEDGQYNFYIDISGAPEPLLASVSPSPSGWNVTCKMPGVNTETDIHSRVIKTRDHETAASLVQLPGISHVICRCPLELDAQSPANRILLKAVSTEFCISEAPAIGLIGTKTIGELIHITPLVWVRDANTLVAETACGSGSLAVGYARYAELKSPTALNLSILQPSGSSIVVSVVGNPDSNVLSGSISGNVDTIDSLTGSALKQFRDLILKNQAII